MVIKHKTIDGDTWEEHVNFKEFVRIKANGAKRKVNSAIEWGKENPDAVFLGGMLVVSGISATAKLVNAVRPSAAEREQKRIRCTYYDPATGMHWQLKRPAKNADRMNILELKSQGYSTKDALVYLNLLK